MISKSFHSHPIGLKFARGTASNQTAVQITRWISNGRVSKFGNGWDSWLDVDEYSAQFGLWVLMNQRTGETYIQRK